MLVIPRLRTTDTLRVGGVVGLLGVDNHNLVAAVVALHLGYQPHLPKLRGWLDQRVICSNCAQSRPAMSNPLPLPTTRAVRKYRLAAGLTQAQAAKLVHLGAASRWAEYENGARKIDLARWELWLILTGQRKISPPKQPQPPPSPS